MNPPELEFYRSSSSYSILTSSALVDSFRISLLEWWCFSLQFGSVQCTFVLLLGINSLTVLPHLFTPSTHDLCVICLCLCLPFSSLIVYVPLLTDLKFLTNCVHFRDFRHGICVFPAVSCTPLHTCSLHTWQFTHKCTVSLASLPHSKCQRCFIWVRCWHSFLSTLIAPVLRSLLIINCLVIFSLALIKFLQSIAWYYISLIFIVMILNCMLLCLVGTQYVFGDGVNEADPDLAFSYD